MTEVARRRRPRPAVSSPAPPAAPIPEGPPGAAPARHPVFYWRRWAFLASALFNMLLLLSLFLAPHLTYAARPRGPRPVMPPLVMVLAIALLVLLFLAPLLTSTVCNVLVFGGYTQTRARYRLTLHALLTSTLTLDGFFFVLNLRYSLSIGYGFLEWGLWGLLLTLHYLIIKSAYDVEPPARLHLRIQSLDPRHLLSILIEQRMRLRLAAGAFWQVYRHTSILPQSLTPEESEL